MTNTTKTWSWLCVIAVAGIILSGVVILLGVVGIGWVLEQAAFNIK